MKFRKNSLIIIILDMIIIIGSLFISYLIRFDFNPDRIDVPQIKQFLPLLIITKFFCFFVFDLYKGMWRYTSIRDMINILKSTFISSTIVVILILIFYRFEGFSRSIFLIDWGLTFLFISASRVIIRFYYEQIQNLPSLNFFKSYKNSDQANILLIGAGDAGEKILRELHFNRDSKYKICGFLDDHKSKAGKLIHGVPVLGKISDLYDIVNIYQIDEIIIAIPSASSREIRNIVNSCEETGIKYKIIPGLGELINGKITVKSIRDVAYRDLLGREVITLEAEKIGAYLNNKVILVTGAGGSIGSELCRQICRFKPSKIVLFDMAETPLYEIDLEIRKIFTEIEVVPSLGDVQDIVQLKNAFKKHKPNTIFHAAAYKHVPMMENHPWKSVNNNIIGTQNVVEISKEFKVERFVFVSTDKAVRPTNVMGATKRIAEIVVQNQNNCELSDTRFMIVRFGNVVGSAGSVIPLFKKQIEKGGPITVTHPDITRYFMTIPEACQLILQTCSMAQGGEIFILDMGEPVKIVDMAKDLIKFSGFEPFMDIDIEFIGLRPGEKLYEELITEGEGIVPTTHKKIMVLNGQECNLDSLKGNIERLTECCKSQDHLEIKKMINNIVPEYEYEKE
ncbi:MAG: polysaccharide biosynthesis protein [Deltaproteobacteria bacterium]|nr:polysaccharide biosynthesis protein [Deltaproteobacteria bacterium]